MKIHKQGHYRNRTWRAENKHQAIIDDRFSPSLLQGSWDNLFEVWNNTYAARGKFPNLLSIESDNVVVDGLFLRNSCGRGILIKDNVAGAVVQSISLILVQWFNHSSINHLTCHHQSHDCNVHTCKPLSTLSAIPGHQ